MKTKYLLALAGFLLLVFATSPVSAQETRTGGNVIVEDGETTESINAYGGTVLVRGTVDGNLKAYAGTVTIDGNVNGDVKAYSGTVAINGNVTGDVEANTGNVLVGESARISGSLNASAGSVLIQGHINGTSTLRTSSLSLGENAVIGGDLRYTAEDYTRGSGAQIGGKTEKIETKPGSSDSLLPSWVFSVYGFLVNLVVGLILIYVFPGLSDAVADEVVSEPFEVGVVGLLVAVGVPIGLILVSITVIGIPIALVLGLLFAVALWMSSVYGSFSLGTWILSLEGFRNRWLSLVIGLLVSSILGMVPIIGGLAGAVITVVGLGGLSVALRRSYTGKSKTNSF